MRTMPRVRRWMAASMTGGLLLLCAAGHADDNLESLYPIRDAATIARTPAGRPTNEAVPFTDGASCSFVRRTFRFLNPNPVLGEPLLMEFLIRGEDNGTNEPSEFIGMMQVGRDMRVDVRGPSNIAFTIEPASIAPRLKAASYKMLPGEFVRTVITMGSDRNSVSGSLFDLPGDYELTVSMKCDSTIPSAVSLGSWMELGKQTVHVSAPEGDDLKAWHFLQPENYAAFEPPIVGDAASADAFSRVLTEAPKAKVAPTVLLAEGTRYFLAGDTPEVFLRCRPYYEQFLRDYPDHPMRGNVVYRMIRVYEVAGEQELARRAFASLWTDPAESMRFRDQEGTRRTYVGDVIEPAAGWHVLNNPADAASIVKLIKEGDPIPGHTPEPAP